MASYFYYNDNVRFTTVCVICILLHTTLSFAQR